MRRWSREITSLHTAALILGAAGLFSRLLGIFRDRLLAGAFGASRELDIYYAAFQIPDFLFNVFLIGATTSAVLPVFLEYWERGTKDGVEFIAGLLRLFLYCSVALSFLVALFAPFLVHYILVPGFEDSAKEQTILLTRIMMLSPVLLGLSNIVASVLQSLNRFFIYSLTSIFYNVGLILGVVVFLPLFGMKGLAYGVVLGAFLHFVIQLPAFYRLGFRFSFRMSAPHDGIKKILKISVPRSVTLSFSALTAIATASILSLFSEGSIAIFRLASNVRYLPIGLVGVSYALASFPKLSLHGIRGERELFRADLSRTIQSVLFFIVPIALGFAVFRNEIAYLLFGTGLFGESSVRQTGIFVAYFSGAIIFESLNMTLVRAFYALGNTKIPLIVAGAVSFGIVGISFVLMKFFGFSALVVPFAFSVLYALQCGWFVVFLKKVEEKKWGGAVSSSLFSAESLKIGIAAFASAGVGFFMARFLPLSAFDFLGSLFRLLAGSGAIAVSYVALLFLFRSEELREILRGLRRRAGMLGYKK
jgi:putative peptidoglycan lipid II flippase